MRKKIAIFAGGWSGEYLQNTLLGISDIAKQNDTDVFSFINFSIHTDNLNLNIPDLNMFKFPDLNDFDGVILFANSFNDSREIEYLTSSIRELHKPAISIEYHFDGIPCIATNNYSGMYDLVDHMLKVHHSRDILFIAGPQDHPESQERIAAFTNAMHDNGVEILEDTIAYGNWSNYHIPEIVDGWVEAHSKYPDTIMCANDIMAIAVSEHLKLSGILAPRDILLTGYDYIRLAQSRIPPITSVNHEWYNMGRKSSELLFSALSGESVPEQTTLNTTFIPGGTCGCPTGTSGHIAASDRMVAISKLDPIETDSHFRHTYYNVRKVKNRLQLFQSYSYFFSHDHRIEGKEFHMFLDPNYFSVSEAEEPLLKEGYPETFDMICGLTNGNRKPFANYSRKDLLSVVTEGKNSPDLYSILPLYSESYTYGIAVLNGPLGIANDNQHYIWTRHLDQALESVRNNILLDQLYQKVMMQSVTDPLTGIYNRAGGQKYTYPRMIEHTKEQGKSAVLLVDVDNMKGINDLFGHATGDLALLTVIEVLKKELPAEFDIARFGGDEFFVGGTLPSEDYDVSALIEHIEKKLEEAITAKELSFNLTISMGAAIISPTEVNDIEKGIVVADAEMYKKKYAHHKAANIPMRK